jgi:hypothetical protein
LTDSMENSLRGKQQLRNEAISEAGSLWTRQLLDEAASEGGNFGSGRLRGAA